eukprot:114883-Chlamydomonas_euryale.AAC.2
MLPTAVSTPECLFTLQRSDAEGTHSRLQRWTPCMSFFAGADNTFYTRRHPLTDLRGGVRSGVDSAAEEEEAVAELPEEPVVLACMSPMQKVRLRGRKGFQYCVGAVGGNVWAWFITRVRAGAETAWKMCGRRLPQCVVIRARQARAVQTLSPEMFGSK